MKKIGINFIEKAVFVKTNEYCGAIQMTSFMCLNRVMQYAPVECQNKSCLLWDFENKTVFVCEDYMMTEAERMNGKEITEQHFVRRPGMGYRCDIKSHDMVEALHLPIKSWTKDPEPDLEKFFDEIDVRGDLAKKLIAGTVAVYGRFDDLSKRSRTAHHIWFC